MTHIVTEACIRCRYTDCVEVCPVDCFYAGEKILAIHPDECIDCGLCVPECPVNAIYAEDDLPKDQLEFKELNKKWSEQWTAITQKEAPPSDADQWRDQKDKREQIQDIK